MRAVHTIGDKPVGVPRVVVVDSARSVHVPDVVRVGHIRGTEPPA